MNELWALLHFIMPSLFDNPDEFNEWFSKDIEAHAHNEGSLTPITAVITPITAVITPIAAVITPIAAVITPIAAVLTPIAAVLTPITAVITPITAVFTQSNSIPTLVVTSSLNEHQMIYLWKYVHIW